MTDFFETPQPDDEPIAPVEQPTIEDAFTELESAMDDIPNGRFITIRHEANAPVYAPLNEGEEAITIRTACDRRNLTLASNVIAYVESNQVDLSYMVPAGGVVMLVGSVKGG